jgi:hypothetical protein
LYLDGIGAFSIEVFLREVLLDLLEKKLNLPSLAVEEQNLLTFGVTWQIDSTSAFCPPPKKLQKQYVL